MTKFFKPEDFETFEMGMKLAGLPPALAANIVFHAARAANAKLEESFGNEYSIVMFWKETMLAERERADRAERELEALRKEIDEAPVTYFPTLDDDWSDGEINPDYPWKKKARLVRIEEMKKP